MKILQVNVVYKEGSTGKLVYDLHNQLVENGHESIICYGRGKKQKEKNIYKIAPEFIMKMQSLRSKITGFAYSGCIVSTNNLIKIIRKEKPDIVHLHCLNGYFVNIYKLMKFLKYNKINTVLTLHAEFMYTGGCGNSLECKKWISGCGNCPQKGSGRPSSKIFDRSSNEWMLMADAFDDFDRLVIAPVSGWLCERAKQSPFLRDKKIIVVTNGIDTENIFKPTSYLEIKKKLKIENEKIILHVTPNFKNPAKGGAYVIDIANSFKDDAVKVIIVGFNGDYTSLPKNVIPVEYTKNQIELAKYYSMADLTIITSKNETFSMVCAESLSCGTPVVGFQAGAPEIISIKRFSEFVPQGDIDALKDVVRNWLSKKQEYGTEISNEARKIYSKKQMYKKYSELYNWFLERGE